MNKEEMIGEMQELLERQHHNIRISKDTEWYDKIKEENVKEDGDDRLTDEDMNEIDRTFREQLLEDFANKVERELGLGIVQLGRMGASLMIDAYSHNNGYHTLDKSYGWYENGTGKHIRNVIDDSWSYRDIRREYGKLKRYEKMVGDLMKRYYDGAGLEIEVIKR